MGQACVGCAGVVEWPARLHQEAGTGACGRRRAEHAVHNRAAAQAPCRSPARDVVQIPRRRKTSHQQSRSLLKSGPAHLACDLERGPELRCFCECVFFLQGAREARTTQSLMTRAVCMNRHAGCCAGGVWKNSNALPSVLW